MPDFTIPIRSESETDALAASVARVLARGDSILLEGPVGAGKSRFCRALIRAVTRPTEDVPSPTFTLVQTYESDRGPIWHVDLYRLGHVDELVEIGLEDAFGEAIVLVEWPERLGALRPAGAIGIAIEHPPEAADDARRITVSLPDDAAPALVSAVRDFALDAFVRDAGWGDAPRAPLPGDASTRRYARLGSDTRGAMLMDAPPSGPPADGPPWIATTLDPFLDVSRALLDCGLSAPRILAADAPLGAAIIEDLGDDLFARVLERNPDMEEMLYAAAVDVLAAIGARRAPDVMRPAVVPPYDRETLLLEARLALDWYLPAFGEAASSDVRDAFEATVGPLFDTVAGGETLVLRDFHAENLLWLPDRTGLARVGLLDYQDALAGHAAYDLVSLLEDARRDTGHDLRERMLARYIAATGVPEPEFRQAYATLGAQRNLKILGIFARLRIRDGKRRYLSHLPRVHAHLMRDLAHPALADLADWCARYLPFPDGATIDRLAAAA